MKQQIDHRFESTNRQRKSLSALGFFGPVVLSILLASTDVSAQDSLEQKKDSTELFMGRHEDHNTSEAIKSGLELTVTSYIKPIVELSTTGVGQVDGFISDHTLELSLDNWYGMVNFTNKHGSEYKNNTRNQQIEAAILRSISLGDSFSMRGGVNLSRDLDFGGFGAFIAEFEYAKSHKKNLEDGIKKVIEGRWAYVAEFWYAGTVSIPGVKENKTGEVYKFLYLGLSLKRSLGSKKNPILGKIIDEGSIMGKVGGVYGGEINDESGVTVVPEVRITMKKNMFDRVGIHLGSRHNARVGANGEKGVNTEIYGGVQYKIQ